MMFRLGDLSDDALTGRLLEVCKAERGMLVECLRCLIELQQRRTALAQGFPSLFSYCTEVLRYSKASAYRRTTAARLLARFPVVGDYLADGRLNLTNLVELRGVLDEEHVVEILDRAAGRTEDEVKKLAAELCPQAAPPDLLRRLPTQRNCSSRSGPGVPAAAAPAPPVATPPAATPPPAPPPPAPPPPASPAAAPVPAAVTRPAVRLEPIAREQHVLRVTVGAAFVQDLEAVRGALSHKLPAGGLEEVLHECLRMTLEMIERRRRGVGKKKVSKAPPVGSPYVPAAVRDQVWRRDEGRCAFVGSSGRRCHSRHRVQVHHLEPRAKGGAATAENLCLRCRAHNLHAAEQDYGRDYIARKVAANRGRSAPGSGADV
jgi:5-methylcytosine-specific restriction endonuclease McrA